MLEIRLDLLHQHNNDALRAYNALYDEENISQPDSFYLWAVESFALKPGMMFLDVACGKGELAYWAAQVGAQGFGNDLSSAAVWQGQQQFADLPLIVANGEQLPYSSNSFDVISSMGSLEHYENMVLGVREMARLVKPAGWVYILVPNTFSLLTNVLIAYKQGRTHADNQPIQRYAARYEWQDLLEQNGLTVHHTDKYERAWPRTWGDTVRYLRQPKQLTRLILQEFIPLNLAFSFVFHCQKAR